ncbi:hypothetical protein FBY35_7083 [Streptomyces sp. SLBN-118]|uniref:hypothetical protein n=1 Tax=Streptomyces sp. SLBN-118 TaxID=2768454 RepID=UPI0011533472|nr:hypothetical protein [Streptomyces sp. SLBN-118]TQK45514.1 hypothetical protein FBY35_7083 [Streptomyces sp. SLBN-118]
MKNSANAATASDTQREESAQPGLARDGRRNGDAGGTLATVTFIVLIAIAISLLGYMVIR